MTRFRGESLAPAALGALAVCFAGGALYGGRFAFVLVDLGAAVVAGRLALLAPRFQVDDRGARAWAQEFGWASVRTFARCGWVVWLSTDTGDCGLWMQVYRRPQRVHDFVLERLAGAREVPFPGDRRLRLRAVDSIGVLALVGILAVAVARLIPTTDVAGLLLLCLGAYQSAKLDVLGRPTSIPSALPADPRSSARAQRRVDG